MPHILIIQNGYFVKNLLRIKFVIEEKPVGLQVFSKLLGFKIFFIELINQIITETNNYPVNN